MWNKIYFAGLSVAIVVMCFFSFYANSWLGSIGSPQQALEGFDYYVGLGTIFLLISAVILLILANVILWDTRRGWAMWTTFIYFSIFVVLRTFWLDWQRYKFENLDKVIFSPPLLGALIVIAAGAVVFSNQFINLRLNERMYPSKISEADLENVGEEKL